MDDKPLLVYFSSVSENTKRFVDKLDGFRTRRIPLRPQDPILEIDEDYFLITPTYGAGKDTKAVPKQVVKFLAPQKTRNHCVGIIGGGNKNFGEHYLYAARQLSEILNVPFIYGFEISGNSEDVREVSQRILEWDKIAKNQKLN